MQQIIKHLFKADSLEEVSRERLEELVREYPSFSVGHYLLSRKLHAEDAADFSGETQKTNLYFTNPFWLQWLLRNTVKGKEAASHRMAAASEFSGNEVQEPVLHPEQIRAEPIFPAAEPVGMERAFVGEDATVQIAEPGLWEKEKTEERANEGGPGETTETWRLAETEKIEEPTEQDAVGTDGVRSEPDVVRSEDTGAGGSGEEKPYESSADQLLKSILEARNLRMSLRKINETAAYKEVAGVETPAGADERTGDAGEHGDGAVVTEEAAGVGDSVGDGAVVTEDSASLGDGAPEEMEPIPGPDDQHETVPEPERIEIAEHPVMTEELITAAQPADAEEGAGGGHGVAAMEGNGYTDETAGEMRTEAAGGIVTTEAGSGMETEAAGGAGNGDEGHAGNGGAGNGENGGGDKGGNGSGEPLFESFHTIDYFASQGIKLSLDENPDDRLGKQMKSFTDWLRVMKRLPQKNPVAVPDLAAEHQVQTIAAHSIEGREVVTETMAEVLAKQGMVEKATDVYLKLSLLNPGKSSYFAAKIEQLKQH